MFDVQTPEDYFFHINNSVEKYKEDKNKSIEGAVKGFVINEQNIEDLIDVVLKFYKNKWFDRKNTKK